MAFPGTTGQFVTAAEWNTMLQAIGLNGVTAPGWVDAQSAWVYVSASSFKVVGADVTARYPVGTKLSCTNSTQKYFYVVSSAFSTDTTITVTGGADYTLADAAITSPRYSYVSKPYGFPSSFDDDPAYVGWSATPTRTCNFTVTDGRLVYSFYISGTGSGTARNFEIPFVPTRSAVYIPLAVAYDNGSLVTGGGNYAAATSGDATIALWKADSLTWTSGNASSVGGQVNVPI